MRLTATTERHSGTASGLRPFGGVYIWYKTQRRLQRPAHTALKQDNTTVYIQGLDLSEKEHMHCQVAMQEPCISVWTRGP